jgi:urocanate hydratase
VNRGVYFFDYGNSFLKAVYDAGVTEICVNGENPLDGLSCRPMWKISWGRCFSTTAMALFGGSASAAKRRPRKTDQAAMACIDPESTLPGPGQLQLDRDAGKNQLVVGTQARILYQDAAGRRTSP